MQARLNWIGSTVGGAADTPFVGVQILVSRGVAQVTDPKGVLAEKAGVLSVDEVGPRERTIRFEDGSEWGASLPERKPCGCR